MEHGDGEGQVEETQRVEGPGVGVVGHGVDGGDLGGVEAGVEGDGVRGGGHYLDGVDMEECRRHEVVILTARGDQKTRKDKKD